MFLPRNQNVIIRPKARTEQGLF